MYDQGELIIKAISDTHNRHGVLELGSGDILIHAGDMTGHGSHEEVLNFINWFEMQDFRHLVLIPGNHDFSMESMYPFWHNECERRGITLLNDTGTVCDGIKIWGSPVQPWFHDWAYNRARTLEEATKRHPWIKNHWDLIPKDTEILVTHGPPYGILDEVRRVDGDSYTPKQHAGCEELLHKVLKTDIKLHIFGHIHECRGVFYEGEVAFVNAASLDRMYCPWSKRPIQIRRFPDKIYMVEE